MFMSNVLPYGYSFKILKKFTNILRHKTAEQCKPSVVTLESGSISGAAAPYEQGEMVTFACNAQYKLIGDSVLTCNNRVWSNAAPLCKREIYYYKPIL